MAETKLIRISNETHLILKSLAKKEDLPMAQLVAKMAKEHAKEYAWSEFLKETKGEQ